MTPTSAPPPRMTLNAVRLLNELLRDPRRPRYAYELQGAIGAAQSHISETLNALVECGWAEMTVQPQGTKSPRRLFTLTAEGAALARTAVQQATNGRVSTP